MDEHFAPESVAGRQGPPACTEVSGASHPAESANATPAVGGTAAADASLPPAAKVPWWRRAFWPVLIFLVTFAVMSLTAWDRALQPSSHFHFVDLANSFMHGEFFTSTPTRYRKAAPRPDDPPGLQAAVDRHLTEGNDKPVGWNDWASYRILKLKGGEVLVGVFPWKDDSGSKKNYFQTLDGKQYVVDTARDLERHCPGWPGGRCDMTTYFVSFPPFPAVAMMPFVALQGYNFNDVLFTTALAGFNALLIFMVLQWLARQGYSRRSRNDNLWLTLLFAFGTVHYFSAVRGEVWFTALIMGVGLNVLFIYFALDARRPLLAGLCLACAMATRTPLMFAAVFFALQAVFPSGRWSGSTLATKVRKLFWFGLPVAVGLGLLMYFNWARFGDPFEFGHKFLMEGTRPSIREHGLFSSWFLLSNLSACFVNVPVITTTAPYLHITRHGLSLLATTPVFVLLLWPRQRSHLWWFLWATVLAVALPALFYQNTGWAQFGYRFGLDWIPYWMMLLAVDGRRIDRKYRVAILISVAINLFGAATFGRAPSFYYD